MGLRGPQDGLFPKREEVATMLAVVVQTINDGFTDQAKTAADGLSDMIRRPQWAEHVGLIGDDPWLHALPEALAEVREQMGRGRIGVGALTRLRAIEAESRCES